MIQDKITQVWVKLTGRKIKPDAYSWLNGIIGDQDIISDKYFQNIARAEGLILETNAPQSGLIDDISVLDFSREELEKLNPVVKDFYEHTSDYDFEIWSEWMGIFKPFGKLLTVLFSKRLQQLNVPTNALAAAKGLKSEIVKLKQHNKVVWTIWYRK